MRLTSSATPAITLTKSANVETAAVGDTVTYTLVASNSGDLTLHGVDIADTDFNGSGTLGPLSCDRARPAVLAPGEKVRCVVSYRVRDGDPETLRNTAVASGRPRAGAPVTASAEARVERDPTSRPSDACRASRACLPETGMSGPLGPTALAGALSLLAGVALLRRGRRPA